jgi:hypothetical protein
MKQIYRVVFALLVIFSVTMSAEALQEKTIYRQNGESAYAEWYEQTPDGSTDKYVNVMNTDDGADIYVSICSSDISGNYSCKSGYTFTTDNVFTMDKKLGSASLSAINVDVYDWNNNVVETVTIQAEWTGIGQTSKGSYKSISKSGDYVSKYSSSSIMREAAATGSLNGVELGTSTYGSIGIFKDASMWIVK